MSDTSDRKGLKKINKKTAASNQRIHQMGTRQYPAEYDGTVSDTTLVESPTRIPGPAIGTRQKVPFRRSSTTYSTALSEALDKKRSALLDNTIAPVDTPVDTPETGLVPATVNQDASIPALVVNPKTLRSDTEFSTTMDLPIGLRNPDVSLSAADRIQQVHLELQARAAN